VTKNPRSTVATVTEIADFLRVLYARIGTIHCLQCGRPVRRDTIDAMVETLFELPPETKATISFAWPLERGLDELRREGFHRVVQDDALVELESAALDGLDAVDVFMDSLALDHEERERLVDSLETALNHGDGRLKVRTDTGRELLFSDKLECKSCRITYEDPVPNLFSFNSPQGACPVCHGFGDLAVFDEDKIIPDPNRSLKEGAVEPWTKPSSRRRLRKLLELALDRGIPTDIPFQELTEEQRDFVFHGEGSYRGVMGFFDRLQRKKYKVQVRVFLARYRKYIPCPDCGQTRLNPLARSVRIEGLHSGEVARKTVKEAAAFFTALKLTPFQKMVAERLLHEITSRLRFLLEVGLDYITLDRMTFTLSGGEAQRINLAAALSSSLVGTLFVLDEPSIGLHARDNQRLIEILRSLKDVGNTVMVVEHDPEIIRSAEYLIDLGPGAGEHGGEVLFSGSMRDFLKAPDSLTARYIRGEISIPIPEKRRKPQGFVSISGAHKHNLKNIDVKIPLQVFTCVTGVSGSGKSSLLFDVLYQGWRGKSDDGFKAIEGKDRVDTVIMVDQSPLSASPRSIPATYTKAMDEIRTLFSQTREAKAQGYRPGFFSFNTSGGRCEHCKGAGQQIVEMQFLSDVVLRCEACKGKRFKKEILEVKYNGRNIDPQDEHRRGPRVLPGAAADRQEAVPPDRGGAGLSAIGTAHHHPVRRGAAADQAGAQPGPPAEEAHTVPVRRAHHRAPPP
jgi:excinuclease ABC subunit A